MEIEVATLMKSLTQQDLMAAAEAYFAGIEDPTFHLAKPFASVDDCPGLLANFAKLLHDGRFLPGHRVLEFGAGSCWAGRLLNQLGMEVTSLDVSSGALALGERLQREHPVFGAQPPHRFLSFDGVRIDLPDGSVDRVFCFDAFHHVVNPGQVIREFARVLADGGSAAFSEPGPGHSRTVESQREMRQHRVVENDVVIEDIWADAQAAGFGDIEFSLQTETSVRLGYDDFRTLRERGPDEALTSRLLASVTSRNRDVTFFYLSKGGPPPLDSRVRDGLVAKLRIDALERVTGTDGRPALRVSLTVENVSDRVWRRSGSSRGSVNLGVHRLDAHGATLAHDHHRHLFLDADLPPGAVAATRVDVPVAAEAGAAVYELDLVSEGVCWFAQNGSEPVRVGA